MPWSSGVKDEGRRMKGELAFLEMEVKMARSWRVSSGSAVSLGVENILFLGPVGAADRLVVSCLLSVSSTPGSMAVERE